MEILLGSITSVLYGVADFLGGQGAKRAPAASIVLWSGAVSFPLLAIAALAVGGSWSPADHALGAAAGALGAVGLVMLFTGLSRGRAAVVAPIAAAVSALVPLVAGVLSGERPSPLAWLGVAVGIPAIMLCASGGDEDGERSGGVLLGTLAGIGFGGFAVVINLTAESSNLLPLVSARAATMVTVLVIAAAGVWKVVGYRQVPIPIVVGNGIFDATANITLLLAIRAGSLALAAVAASFYPAVTVLLSKLVNSEHIRARQSVGLAMTLIALGLIAIG